MTWLKFAAGLVGTVVVAAILIWPFSSGRWRGPERASGTPAAIDQGDHAEATTTTERPEPAITVAAAGGLVENGLAPLESEFFDLTGLVVDVRRLETELAVWKLAVDENLLGADIIEVGFRTDAISGIAADAFLPLDPESVPSLASIPSAYRLPDDRGVVVGFTGLLGIAVDTALISNPPGSWSDLESFAFDGVLGLPAPGSVLAPVLVLGMGEGDIDAGVQQYVALIEAGAIPLRTVDDYVQAFREGLGVAVWTSSGLWRSGGQVQNVEFVAPVEGAIPLPAFSGVMADTDRVDAARRWIEFRLSATAQAALAGIAEQGRFGASDIPAVSPVIAGIEGLPLDDNSYFTLDGFEGALAAIDWSAYGDARAAIDAAVGEGDG